MSNNSEKLATLVTKDNPEKGKVIRLFRVTCGICEVHFTEQADSFEGFCNLIDKQFHLSSTHGWVHHACQKRVPAFLSLTRKQPTTQANETNK